VYEVASATRGGGIALGGRSTRHASYNMSQIVRKRQTLIARRALA
jgi:hypothetical protein